MRDYKRQTLRIYAKFPSSCATWIIDISAMYSLSLIFGSFIPNVCFFFSIEQVILYEWCHYSKILIINVNLFIVLQEFFYVIDLC